MVDDERADDPRGAKPGGSLLQVGLVLFVACYFGALLFWFGRLFLTGGTEEHVVMSIMIPVVILVGLVGVVTLSTIVLEGRRAARDEADQPETETR